jgi:hypothetical protein
MKTILRASLVIFVLGLLVFFASCVYVKMNYYQGKPIDWDRLPEVESGVTTFSEILQLFGPPHYIIDGAKELVDNYALANAKPCFSAIPTRMLSAPEGQVILIYQHTKGKLTLKGPAVAAALLKLSNDMRPNELFIYLSKKDWIVAHVVSGPRDSDGGDG